MGRPDGQHGERGDQIIRLTADAMRRIRHLRGRAENDFDVIASDFLSTLWNQLTGAIEQGRVCQS